MEALNTSPERKLALREVFERESDDPYLWAWMWIATWLPKDYFPVAAEDLEA